MIKIFFLPGFILFLFSCKKCDLSQKYDCDNISGSIVGEWTLAAHRSYTAPHMADTSWQIADAANSIRIDFSKDSLFTYSSNYNWSMENYNKYTMIDSRDFRIYSTNPPVSGDFPHYPSAFVKMITANEIELIYMGVDAGVEEKYSYTCSNK